MTFILSIHPAAQLGAILLLFMLLTWDFSVPEACITTNKHNFSASGMQL